MAADGISLKWKRPESSEYPKVWHRFSARDLNSDKIVEYRIEDLCRERANDAYNHMKENYFRDEPIGDALSKLTTFCMFERPNVNCPTK